MESRFSDDYHARIRPVPDGEARPLWTVLIPTYNCASYLEEALSSVLDQDPGSELMEIIVVDDCSDQDDPGEVVERLAGERVTFVRQEKNVGKIYNYETGLQLSRGRLIHQLHGDDRVRPDFYLRMAKLLEENPEAGFAFCRSIYIDDRGRWLQLTGSEQDVDGIILDFLSRIYCSQRLQTPSAVLRREVYETLGGFDRRLDCLEDWEMWIRAASMFPVAFTNEVLAEYRQHDHNCTQQTYLNGRAIESNRWIFEHVDSYLPDSFVSHHRKSRNRAQAQFWIDAARALHPETPGTVRRSFLIYALRLSPRLDSFRRIAGILLR